jgi:hypothetical protein
MILLTKCRQDLHKTTALVTYISHMQGSQSTFRYYLHEFQLLSGKTCESQVCNSLSNSKSFFSTFHSLFNIRHDTWHSIGTRGKSTASHHVSWHRQIPGNSVGITIQTLLLMSMTLTIWHQQAWGCFTPDCNLYIPWLQHINLIRGMYHLRLHHHNSNWSSKFSCLSK